MSKVIVERDDMVAIADAVREKSNTAALMNINEITTKINEIPGNSGTYVWEKYQDIIREAETTSNVITKSLSYSYAYSSDSQLTFYSEAKYENGAWKMSGTTRQYYNSSSIYISSTSTTLWPTGAVPDGYYVKVGNNVYRTTASTEYKTYYGYISTGSSYSYYHLQLTNVIEISMTREFVECVVSDIEDFYPNDGILNSYYYKMIPAGYIPKATVKISFPSAFGSTGDGTCKIYYLYDGELRNRNGYYPSTNIFEVDKNSYISVIIKRTSGRTYVSGFDDTWTIFSEDTDNDSVVDTFAYVAVKLITGDTTLSVTSS